MKNTAYIILLAAEAIIGLISLGLFYSWFGWIGLIALSAVVAALMIVLVIRLKKQKASDDTKGIGKTRVLIAVTLLIPTLIALIIGVFTVISMLLYFG